jgi:hypothetical protein
MIATGKACAHITCLPISPHPHLAKMEHQIYQQVVTQFKMKHGMSNQITSKQKQLQTTITIASTLEKALIKTTGNKFL